MRFSWDESKSAANEAKHRVTFDRASALFSSGVEFLELFDEDHSDDEERFIAIGPIDGRIVLVVWSEQDDESIRIISARWATRRERDLFHERMRRTT